MDETACAFDTSGDQDGEDRTGHGQQMAYPAAIRLRFNLMALLLQCCVLRWHI
jgi:hypothetical protein